MATTKAGYSSRQKLALVIGNDNYTSSYNKLNHSVNNANDLSGLLKQIDFKVTTVCNLTKKDSMSCIINFSKLINNGDLVLFYFSGHVCQANGKNYLVPVDDDTIQTDRDIDDFCINVERTITRFVKYNLSYCTVFLVDCCIPYRMRSSSASAGCK